MLGSFQEFQHRPTVSSKLSTFAAKEEYNEALTLKVMSGDDKHPVRTVTLPATIGRPTGASGLMVSDNNALFNNSLISRKHAVIHMENKQVNQWKLLIFQLFCRFLLLTWDPAMGLT